MEVSVTCRRERKNWNCACVLKRKQEKNSACACLCSWEGHISVFERILVPALYASLVTSAMSIYSSSTETVLLLPQLIITVIYYQVRMEKHLQDIKADRSVTVMGYLNLFLLQFSSRGKTWLYNSDQQHDASYNWMGWRDVFFSFSCFKAHFV